MKRHVKKRERKKQREGEIEKQSICASGGTSASGLNGTQCSVIKKHCLEKRGKEKHRNTEREIGREKKRKRKRERVRERKTQRETRERERERKERGREKE